MSSKLLVFREQSYLFGIIPTEFDKHLLLSQVTISPDEKHKNLWTFEAKDKKDSGYFIHPAELFDFNKIMFSQKSVLFLKNQLHSKSPTFGLLMNDFYMQISEKRLEPKKLELDVVKNFPSQLPKSAFHFVQRYKRKNIFVINPDALLKKINTQLPDASES